MINPPIFTLLRDLARAKAAAQQQTLLALLTSEASTESPKGEPSTSSPPKPPEGKE